VVNAVRRFIEGRTSLGSWQHAPLPADWMEMLGWRLQHTADVRHRPTQTRAAVQRGDTACGDFFHDIPQRLGPVGVALLPIGAYEPCWFMRAVHMNPAEAFQAHLDLGASQSIGMHFGTFPMTIEGIDEPTRALKDACRAANLPLNGFRTLDFAESLRIAAPQAPEAR
jgi:L-ascorbate metabolism protein UlaG (beta-lactamase superfamily)